MPLPALRTRRYPRVRLFLATFITLLSTSLSTIAGVTSLSDGAESGEGQITKQINSGYSLIQNTIVAVDNSAFRLARNAGNPNWFEFNDTIDVQADTKLAFQSQLSWSLPGETARVQISTDGGATWTDLFSQQGTGGQVETSFAFREFSLAAYAGQSVKIRFYYDYSGGGWFDVSFNTVGWFLDNIQIGPVIQKNLYSVGNPSDDAQVYLEYINRARADAMAEANWLKNLTDPDVLNAMGAFGINPNHIVSQFTWNISHIIPGTGNPCMNQFAQPLSFNEKLNTSAECHTQDMFQNRFQGHTSSSNPPNCNGTQFNPHSSISNRMDEVGYNFQTVAENVFAYSESNLYGHAGFNIDWGNSTNSGDPCYNSSFSGQGMQNPAGHRINIHSGRFKEIGIGVVNGTNGSVGPQLVTQDFGNTFENTTFVTGCVYEDANGNNFYDKGEGRGGIRVDVTGSAYYAVSTSSGAYSVPLNGNGSYDVTFTAPGMATRTVSITVTNDNNVKIDHEPQYGQTYADWAAQHGLVGNATDDDDLDGTVNLVEFALAGAEPNVPEFDLVPTAVEANGKFTLTINKRPGVTGIVYTVYVSTDLINWTTTGVTVEVDDATTLIASSPTTGHCLFITFAVSNEP
ncbi:MAG: carboxypeptidase regulatory-like domain-containing protein [Verrucomicrobiota bacterium]